MSTSSSLAALESKLAKYGAKLARPPYVDRRTGFLTAVVVESGAASPRKWVYDSRPRAKLRQTPRGWRRYK